MKRFRIVNLLLVALVALAGWRTVQVWQRQAPAPMANAGGVTPIEPPPARPRQPGVPQLVNAIASKDLFDVSRKAPGQDDAPAPQQTPAPPPTLKLAGVIMIGSHREAVFIDTSQGNKQLRMQEGEELAGYRVNSISASNVSLVSGSGDEVNVALALQTGSKKRGAAFGPGGKATPRPRNNKAKNNDRNKNKRLEPAEMNPGAFGSGARADRGKIERQRAEARERAQRARERLKRLRAEAARR